ncbi:divergent polysaccharide deacetylase family protein [Roseospira marina]|uniref:Divergent polysaccharide deacetylase family protein n=1 Tax=Roseospira marina TaxID=140057 RepID=A0A5M6IBZ3_9PROT|nr:divergent polysaccharide deacetylase family protein [Roseospira marina]KAA5605642.1 divergent polysaccharide deacetylase family protein [Roseospira marina]MBB4313283.1 hypothetical protein [Roseospira marina]MBB5085976.1 hypothetical protein [Roseospira marina]
MATRGQGSGGTRSGSRTRVNGGEKSGATGTKADPRGSGRASQRSVSGAKPAVRAAKGTTPARAGKAVGMSRTSRAAGGTPHWAVSGNRGARAAMTRSGSGGVARRALFGGAAVTCLGVLLGLRWQGSTASPTVPVAQASPTSPPHRIRPGTVTVADVPPPESVRIDLPMAEGASPDVLASPTVAPRVAVPDRSVLASLPPTADSSILESRAPALTGSNRATPSAESLPPEPDAVAALAPVPAPGPKPEEGHHQRPVQVALTTRPPVLAPPSVPAAPGAPLWLANALNVAHPGQRPMISVVIDDLGLDRGRTRQVLALPGPLTLSFMAYAGDLSAQTAAGRAQGHELMLHMPMQPGSATVDPGPGALLVDLPAAENRRRLERALTAFSGYIGLNNHMGSRYTANTAGMRVVMDVARRRELLFLDSRTTGSSVAPRLALSAGVPFLERAVFIDHIPGRGPADKALAELERVAARHGHAVAIGHPRDATIAALSDWIEPARTRGFALVPASAIARFARNV